MLRLWTLTQKTQSNFFLNGRNLLRMNSTPRFSFSPLKILLSCSFAFFIPLSPAYSENVKTPDLWKIDLRGGNLLRPAGLDLTQPDAEWVNQSIAKMKYDDSDSSFRFYRLHLKDLPTKETTKKGEATKLISEIVSKQGIPVKANRNYLLSALVRADFPRKSMEINLCMRFFDVDGQRAGSRQLKGLPEKTEGPDGWQRLEWTLTVPDDPRIHEGRACISPGWIHYDTPPELSFADFAFVELPAKALVPTKRGEGVTFPGSVGSLPMKVESATEKGGVITVETTGARFEFHTSNDTVIASQRIEFPRKLAQWQTSLPLAGLRIDQQNADVCVLSNEHLTIGVQADSMVAFNPHQELEMTLTNLLGGDFNRYARGHVYSTDDFGGITVNPYCPPGTGRTPRSALLTEGLSFAQFAERDYEQLGAVQQGWMARWTLSPGELLCTSVFPPRPYPWEESFRSGWKLAHSAAPLTYFEQNIPFVDTWILWDYIPKMWGHSYSDEYEPRSEGTFRAVMEKIHSQGHRAIPYMSAYWTPTRDADVYIAGVRNFAQKYGIDGVYSDGLPPEDWMLAYREMRMLRDLFPDGPISVHDSVRQANLDIAQIKPFLYTYANFTYMAEGIETKQGANWQYPRYVTSMFRKTNNLGVTKGDKWQDAEGQVMGERKNLVDLVYNGRDNIGFNVPTYYAALQQMHELWREKGREPFFYDRYYLPKAQEITGYRIGRAAMPIDERSEKNGKVTISLKSLTPGAVIRYTTDGTVPDEDSALYETPLSLAPELATRLRTRAYAEGLEPSAVTPLP